MYVHVTSNFGIEICMKLQHSVSRNLHKKHSTIACVVDKFKNHSSVVPESFVCLVCLG